jgi:hypothetical protein
LAIRLVGERPPAGGILHLKNPPAADEKELVGRAGSSARTSLHAYYALTRIS